MAKKPRNPHPFLLRRVLRCILPMRHYRRYVGRHEDESLRLWRGLASRVPPSGAILDIGAFRGEYALAAREVNPRAPVYAFEPNPHTLHDLHAACAGKNVCVMAEAVADENGTVGFLCSSAQSRIETATAAKSPGEVCQVPAVTLEFWVREQEVAPSLIKIDVEEAEAGILRAARRVLEDFMPVILCEVLTDAAGAEVEAAVPSLYSFWHINENGGVTEQDRITRRLWRNKNWLLVPHVRRGEMPI
jgi:FkbM family methyltransferase